MSNAIQAVVWHDLEGFTAGAISHWNTGVASAHIIIKRDGTIVLAVKIENTAWHAGSSSNPASGTYGRTPFWRENNINAYSIGVELEGFAADGPGPPIHVGGFESAQIVSCVKIAKWAKQKYGVPLIHIDDQIPGHHLHSEISNLRSDPGPLFNLGSILAAAA